MSAQLGLQFPLVLGDYVRVLDIDEEAQIMYTLEPIMCKDCLHSKITNACQDQKLEGCVPGYYWDDEHGKEHRTRQRVYYVQNGTMYTWKVASDLQFIKHGTFNPIHIKARRFGL